MKMYPFSAKNHAHDIELIRNRRYILAQEALERKDFDTYDKMMDLYDEATEVLDSITSGMRGYSGVTMLTGPMLGKAKEMVFMAAELRAYKNHN